MANVGGRAVRPLLSVDRDQAKRRVLNLYKAWFRQLGFIVRRFDIPKTYQQVRTKLREEFLKNKDMNDSRAKDMLVIRGHMLLQEVMEVWLQKPHLMRMYLESVEPKPEDFMGKFLYNTKK